MKRPRKCERIFASYISFPEYTKNAKKQSRTQTTQLKTWQWIWTQRLLISKFSTSKQLNKCKLKLLWDFILYQSGLLRSANAGEIWRKGNSHPLLVNCKLLQQWWRSENSQNAKSKFTKGLHILLHRSLLSHVYCHFIQKS